MKSRLLVLSLSSILVFASTISFAGSGYSSVLAPMASTTVHVAGSTALKGSIANVQLDGDGDPEWVQSGICVLRLWPGASESN